MGEATDGPLPPTEGEPLPDEDNDGDELDDEEYEQEHGNPLEWEDGLPGDTEKDRRLEAEVLGDETSSSEVDSDFARMRLRGEDTAEERAGRVVAQRRGAVAAAAVLDGDSAAAGMLVVPDDCETVPVAVRAAAWVDARARAGGGGGCDPVGIYVRKGIHRWDKAVSTYEKWALDMPPGVEVLEGVMQNSSAGHHFVYESQLEIVNGTALRPVLHLTGDPGALMWGRWALDKGTTGTMRGVQVLSDSLLPGEDVHDMAAATLEVVSSNFTLSQCGVRCVRGVCLRVAGEASVVAAECGLGGLGPEERSLCSSCVTAWDRARVAASKCAMTDGMIGSAGLRACEESEVAARGCRMERLFVGASVHNRAILSLVDCRLKNQSHAALFAGGKHEEGTRLTMQGCVVDGVLWADDGRPGRFKESGTTLLGGNSRGERELEELTAETEALERKIAELEAMETPEDALRSVLAREGEEVHEDSLLEGLTSDKLDAVKAKLRYLRNAMVNATDIPKGELVRELGPEVREWLDSESEEGGGGGAAKGREDESWDTSEEERGSADSEESDGRSERKLLRNEKLLRQVLEMVERVPPEVRTEDDLRVLHDVPAMLQKVDVIKGEMRGEPPQRVSGPPD